MKLVGVSLDLWWCCYVGTSQLVRLTPFHTRFWYEAPRRNDGMSSTVFSVLPVNLDINPPTCHQLSLVRAAECHVVHSRQGGAALLLLLLFCCTVAFFLIATFLDWFVFCVEMLTWRVCSMGGSRTAQSSRCGLSCRRTVRIWISCTCICQHSNQPINPFIHFPSLPLTDGLVSSLLNSCSRSSSSTLSVCSFNPFIPSRFAEMFCFSHYHAPFRLTFNRSNSKFGRWCSDSVRRLL